MLTNEQLFNMPCCCASAVVDERREMTELLTQLKVYVENIEEILDGEYGASRTVKDMVADGDMPTVYTVLCEVLALIGPPEENTP